MEFNYYYFLKKGMIQFTSATTFSYNCKTNIKTLDEHSEHVKLGTLTEQCSFKT